MVYNISFDIAAVLVLAVLSIALATVHYTESRRSKLFRVYILTVMINAIMDIITCITISYSGYVSDWLNQVLNTLYQLSSALSV